MKKTQPLRTALLAAVSLSAAGAASVAHAELSAVPPTVSMEAPLVNAADEAAAKEVAPTKIQHKWLIAAFATGALAALMRFLGVSRLVSAMAEAAPGVAKVAGEAARAPIKAAKVVGNAISPLLKSALLFAGLGLVAFTGVGVYNIEWAGGLAVGAAMAGLAWYGAIKTKNAFLLRPVRVKSDRTEKHHRP